SSRRRHTRSKRDWSSDVCSSDLFRQKISVVLLSCETMECAHFPRASCLLLPFHSHDDCRLQLISPRYCQQRKNPFSNHGQDFGIPSRICNSLCNVVVVKITRKHFDHEAQNR